MAGTMVTPPSLNLLVLTFNCGKNLINVPVFAAHLRTALLPTTTGPGIFDVSSYGAGAGTLPEIVAFSLQEVAPLAYSFVGSYFLSPYYARFEEALNLATSQIVLEQQSRSKPVSSTTSRQNGGPSSSLPSPTTPTNSRGSSGVEGSASSWWSRLRGHQPQQAHTYKLVKVENVGMTAIMLFARTPSAIHDLRMAEVAFGASDMGNKGAVALRFTYENDLDNNKVSETRSAEVTIVATHLAAMEWNLRRRNANWRSIVSGLTFANPKHILPSKYHIDEPGRKATVEASAQEDDIASQVSENEHDQLLARHINAASMSEALTQDLQSISVFKPESYLFVAGDLNYRISTTTPPALARFPDLDQTSDDFFPQFLERDQLSDERKAGRTLHGLQEARIEFPPTYKIVHLEGVSDAVNVAQIKRRVTGGLDDDGNVPNTPVEVGPSPFDDKPVVIEESELYVPYKWASHRWPGWCDRILYLDVPEWVKSRYSGRGEKEPVVQISAYKSLPVMRTSDHRPVFLRASVPLLTHEEMIPDQAAEAADGIESSSAAETTTNTPRKSNVVDPRLKLPVPIDTGAWERRAAAKRKEFAAGWSMMLFSTREGAVFIATAVLLGLGGWWAVAGPVLGG